MTKQQSKLRFSAPVDEERRDNLVLRGMQPDQVWVPSVGRFRRLE
eukprot:CAMPEP_0115142374 /NCGR_PEP_ID=MMETSP0227-20121206/60117_1 /TAXON_ID=89957 /ORGANISM="Polarella glacialis, Strain CCMP 1383" /LENGTH=44 /DNA_ID= /DNA_START= /DNA_END= /DNA_ORIENTATION=